MSQSERHPNNLSRLLELIEFSSLAIDFRLLCLDLTLRFSVLFLSRLYLIAKLAGAARDQRP